MRQVDIAPNQRIAFVGKTRSGKSTHARALSGILVPGEADKAGGWEAWWVETKHDPKDYKALTDWGYKDGFDRRNRKSTRKVFRLYRGKIPVWEQAQTLFGKAYDRGGIVVIVDEYKHVVASDRNAGDELLNIFQRGGGRDVGLIGNTQEPVYVPRQLLSQATHNFLYSVTYPLDIQYLTQLYGDYRPPIRLWYLEEICEALHPQSENSHTNECRLIRPGYPYGFYHVAVDYDGLADFYTDQYQWFKKFASQAA